MLYASMGFFFGSLTILDPTNDELVNPGIFFIVIGIIGVIFCVVLGVLTLLVSKYIKETKHYNFIFAWQS